MTARVGFLYLCMWVIGVQFISSPVLANSSASQQGLPTDETLDLASIHALVSKNGSLEPIFALRADKTVPIASITKLMTAIVVLNADQPLDEMLTLVRPPNRFNKALNSRLRTDTKISRRDMLKLALMSSENAAAASLAIHYKGGENAFVKRMNEIAKVWGMHSTSFVEPTGLSPDNRSSARDLMVLAQHALRYDIIREFSTYRQVDMNFRSPRYSLSYVNTNPLTRNDKWQVLLSKTGYINEAGRCLLMVTRIDNEEYIIVLLDSFGRLSPIGDTSRITAWIKGEAPSKVPAAAKNYHSHRLQTLGY